MGPRGPQGLLKMPWGPRELKKNEWGKILKNSDFWSGSVNYF